MNKYQIYNDSIAKIIIEGIYPLGDGNGYLIEISDDDFFDTCCKLEYCTWNGTEWVEDFDKYKEIKIQDLKSIKNEKISKCKVATDTYFQTDDVSERTIEGRLVYMYNIDDTIFNSKTSIQYWRTLENAEFTFATRQDAIDTFEAVLDKTRETWGVYNSKTIAINACVSCEEVDAIDLNSDWVEMDITV